mgnify:CR=1 FL=1
MTKSSLSTPRDRIMVDVAMIAKAHGVALSDIIGRTRHRKVARARHTVMWFVWWHYGWSMPRVGRLLGGRDPSTVWLGIGAHLARCGMDHWTVESREKKLERMKRRARFVAEDEGGWRIAA